MTKEEITHELYKELLKKTKENKSLRRDIKTIKKEISQIKEILEDIHAK